MDLEPDWPAMGAKLRDARERQNIAQGAGGVSAATWRKVEKGISPPYRRATLVALARAVGWPDDAWDRMMAGRPPDEHLSQTAGERTWDELVARLDVLEAELQGLRDDLARRRSGHRT